MKKKIAGVIILILLKVLMLMVALLLFRATLATQKLYVQQAKVATNYVKKYQKRYRNLHCSFGSKMSYP